MLDHLELALISKQVYFKKEGKVIGWKRTNYFANNDGLGVCVYEKNNQMVIAFRGTDTGNLKNFIKNLLTDIRLCCGKSINTLESAKKFVKDIREKRTYFQKFAFFLLNLKCNQLYLTGHSLGGTIAAMVGYEMIKAGKNYQVVTFESPGFLSYLSKEDKKNMDRKIQERFITYLADPNLINTIHEQVGMIRRVRIKTYKNDFFSKYQHHASYYLDCGANDILRLIFFFLFLNLIYSTLIGENLNLDNIIVNISAISNIIGQSIDLRLLDRSNTVEMFYFFVKFVFYTMACKIINKLFSITSKQHALDGIINALTKADSSETIVEIERWPNCSQYLLTQGREFFRWLNPLNHRSLLNLSDPDLCHEEEVKQILGYKEKGSGS